VIQKAAKKAIKEEWLSMIDACEQIGISYSTLRDKVIAGRVNSRRRGEGKTAKIYVHRDDVIRLRDAYQLIG